MKFFIVLCVFVTTLLVKADASWPNSLLRERGVGEVWQDCSKAGDIAKIESVKITPDLPVKGEKVSIDATVSILNESLSDGLISVVVKIDGIPLVDKDYSLCSESALIGLDCPIKAGQHKLTNTVTITDLAPPGNYSIHATITEQNKKEVLCISAYFKL